MSYELLRLKKVDAALQPWIWIWWTERSAKPNQPKPRITSLSCDSRNCDI